MTLNSMRSKQAVAADESESSSRSGIQVIARAAEILRALERNPRGLSLGEISKLVDLPRSTVQRIVDALDEENLVLASTTALGVRLGPGLLPLAAATRFEVAELARSTLERIAKESGETVDLSVVDQDKAVFVDQIPGTHRLTAVSSIGKSFELHCSANGKAALALMDDVELARAKRKMKLTPRTASTITTWDKLDRELAGIRTTGLAFDREEHSPGICAVGMAVRSIGGEIASVSIPVPSQRFTRSEKKLAAILEQHCTTLRNKLARV